MRSQFAITVRAMTSHASVAMAAAAPVSLAKTNPIGSAIAAVTATATRIAGTNESSAWTRKLGACGISDSLIAGDEDTIAVVYAPIAMKPTWPNETTPELPVNVWSPITTTRLIRKSITTFWVTAVDRL